MWKMHMMRVKAGVLPPDEEFDVKAELDSIRIRGAALTDLDGGAYADLDGSRESCVESVASVAAGAGAAAQPAKVEPPKEKKKGKKKGANRRRVNGRMIST